MTASRRLAAILAPDVAGYSRLMGADASLLTLPIRIEERPSRGS